MEECDDAFGGSGGYAKLANLENRVLSKWMYKKKISYISAMIVSVY